MEGRREFNNLVIRYEDGYRFAHEKTTVEELIDSPISTMHAHKAHEIYYLEQGDVTYTVSDRVYKVEEGSIAVINAYVLHKVDIKPTKDYIRYVLEVPVNIIPTINGINPLNRFFNMNNFINIIPKENVESSNALSILKRMESEYDSSDNYANHILDSNTILYVTEIAKIFDKQQNFEYNYYTKTDKNSRTINEVIKYINNNIGNKLSVDIISQEINYSRSYVQHIFKKLIGVSLSEYILIQKMQTANYLLENGMMLKEVAVQVGYKYYPTFFAAYKKFFGYSPKERKKNKKNW